MPGCQCRCVCMNAAGSGCCKGCMHADCKMNGMELTAMLASSCTDRCTLRQPRTAGIPCDMVLRFLTCVLRLKTPFCILNQMQTSISSIAGANSTHASDHSCTCTSSPILAVVSMTLQTSCFVGSDCFYASCLCVVLLTMSPACRQPRVGLGCVFADLQAGPAPEQHLHPVSAAPVQPAGPVAVAAAAGRAQPQ